MEDKLNVCKKIRSLAASTLAIILRESLSNKSQVSEKIFCDQWLAELRKHQEIFPDGWYAPPPHGIGVLFGETKKDGRQNYKTLRPESMWPKDDIYLENKNEIAYFFASPVDRKTGVIGDFGITVYLGNNQETIEYLKRCMHINNEIFNFIEIGKKFSEVYHFAEEIIASQRLTNEVTSSSDPTGKDYGHTIPATDNDWTNEEQTVIKNGKFDWESVKNMINKKRVFINAIEETTFQPGMAITLEPRLTIIDNQDIPMGSFHTIVSIKPDGTKDLLTNFDEIFKISGMNYMLSS